MNVYKGNAMLTEQGSVLTRLVVTPAFARMGLLVKTVKSTRTIVSQTRARTKATALTASATTLALVPRDSVVETASVR